MSSLPFPLWSSSILTGNDPEDRFILRPTETNAKKNLSDNGVVSKKKKVQAFPPCPPPKHPTAVYQVASSKA